mgnify:CR=1 FL=1
MDESKLGAPKVNLDKGIVPILIVGAHYEDDETQNYTPYFEIEGSEDVESLGDSYGMGVFKQNGKFYFSGCHNTSPKTAFQIPEKVALRIVSHIKTKSPDPLVESLWSSSSDGDRQDTLNKLI